MRLRSGRRVVSPVAAPRGAAPARRVRPRCTPYGGDGGVGEEEEKDRLSSLPLDLQLEVLARLQCARGAARASVLSRPWRGLWTQLRELTFDDTVDPGSLAGALSQLGELTKVRPKLSRLCIHLPGSLKKPGDARIASLLDAADKLKPVELVVKYVDDSAARMREQQKKKLGRGVPCDLGSPTQSTSVTNGFRCDDWSYWRR